MLMLGVAAAWQWLIPGPAEVIFSSRAAASVLTGTGFSTMMYAWWQFNARRVAICPTAPSAHLITDGIYRFTRNPMYAGITAMLSGVALWIGTMPFYGVAIGFFVVMDRVFCPYEEQRLLDTFGEAYAAYLVKVRRWF
jgi:protein-S-isoprenylcysteine O-methyltransferase Ste14